VRHSIGLFDIEDRFSRTDCGKRGADARPDFNLNFTGQVTKISADTQTGKPAKAHRPCDYIHN